MNHPFNITDLFFEQAAQNPQKIAIIDRNMPISFGDFAADINDTAAYFLKKGIQKGDRVMIFVPMSINLYRTVLALFKIGATAVFLDEWVSIKRLALCCEIAKCKAFIGIFKARVIAFFLKELRKIPVKLGTNYQKKWPLPTLESTSKSDTALITFTTGSTGTPKAAKRTHGFLQEQFNALIDKIQPKPDDIAMPVLPIVLLLNLGAGSTSVITNFKASKPHKMKPEDLIDQMKKHQVNRMIASPFVVKKIAEYVMEYPISLPLLEKVFTGGAPVFPAEAAIYHQAFPKTKVEVVYGSTEAEPISSINVKELVKEQANFVSKGLNVGIPYRKTAVKVIKITDEIIKCDNEAALKKLEIQSGEIGEIIVSGSHVLREYFNNEAALKRNKIFFGNDCWHRTGDSGYLGENGSLYLTGRCNTLIKINKKVVAPFIYESYFQSLEGVEMGTVLQKNHQILIIIELNDLTKKEAIIQAVKSLDFPYNQLIFIKKIPRDPRHNSKIDYPKLRDQL